MWVTMGNRGWWEGPLLHTQDKGSGQWHSGLDLDHQVSVCVYVCACELGVGAGCVYESVSVLV